MKNKSNTKKLKYRYKHETYYTSRLVKELNAHGYNVWRQEGGIYAGIPDIIGYDKFGVFVAIEVKIENGKLTPLQEIFLSKLRTTPHGKAYVVRIYDGHFRANEFQQRR